MAQQMDKWGRDYNALLAQQKRELEQWKRVLTPAAFAELQGFCEMMNGPADEAELRNCLSSNSYKAGGLHSCPVNQELHHFVIGIGAPVKATSVPTDGSELL